MDDYLSSELPVFFELRVRYLQACERMQEAKALAKSCLENCEAGKHLYFHQAYLTCLYKASLHEHLHKEVRDVESGRMESIKNCSVVGLYGSIFLKSLILTNRHGYTCHSWETHSVLSK